MIQYNKKLVLKRKPGTVCGIPYIPQHIGRPEAASKFPKRIKLGANRVSWVLSEVNEWMAKCIANRDTSNDTDSSFWGVMGNQISA